MIKLSCPCEVTVSFTPKTRAIVAYDSVRNSELGEDLFCAIRHDATWRWIWQLSDDRVRGVVISDYQSLVSFWCMRLLVLLADIAGLHKPINIFVKVQPQCLLPAVLSSLWRDEHCV